MEQQKTVDQNAGANLIVMLRTIWKIKKRLMIGVILGAVLGLIIGVSTPKEYTVTVTLTPELSGFKSNGGLASVAASFLGSDLSQSGSDAVNALLAPEIVKSTPFLLELLDARVVNKAVGIDTTLVAYLETEKGPWWGIITQAPKRLIGGIKSLFETEIKTDTSLSGAVHSSNIIRLSKEQSSMLGVLKSKVNALLNSQTSLISLYVNMQDPVVAAQVADSVVTKLQKYLVNYKSSKAKEDCLYWERLYKSSKEKYYHSQQIYANYVDAHSDVIYQRTLVEKERLQNAMNFDYQAYTQVAQQLQMAQAKVQEAKPSFTIVEPAVIPELPIGMGKMTRMILYACLVVFVLIGWELFLKEFLLDFKNAFLGDK